VSPGDALTLVQTRADGSVPTALVFNFYENYNLNPFHPLFRTQGDQRVYGVWYCPGQANLAGIHVSEGLIAYNALRWLEAGDTTRLRWRRFYNLQELMAAFPSRETHLFLWR
jgi:hypothetical protein